MLLVGSVAKGLVLAESAAAQVDRLCFLDDVALGVLDNNTTSDLVRAIGQGGDHNLVFAHGRSMAGGPLKRSLALPMWCC